MRNSKNNRQKLNKTKTLKFKRNKSKKLLIGGMEARKDASKEVEKDTERRLAVAQKQLENRQDKDKNC